MLEGAHALVNSPSLVCLELWAQLLQTELRPHFPVRKATQLSDGCSEQGKKSRRAAWKQQPRQGFPRYGNVSGQTFDFRAYLRIMWPQNPQIRCWRARGRQLIENFVWTVTRPLRLDPDKPTLQMLSPDPTPVPFITAVPGHNIHRLQVDQWRYLAKLHMIKLEQEDKWEERESWLGWDVPGLLLVKCLTSDNEVRNDGKQSAGKSK